MDALTIGRALLAGRMTRKLATATYVRDLGNDLIAVAYHETDVVQLSAAGILLQTGGWPTVTTLKRINDVLSIGFDLRVSGSTLRNGNLPRKPRAWQVFGPRRYDNGRSVVTSFYDVPDAEPVDVLTGQNPYTGRAYWGSNIAGALPQMATLPAVLLAEYVRSSHVCYVDDSLCGECGAHAVA